MSDKRDFYTPKERRAVMLRVCSWLFTAGTAAMWIFRDRFGIERGDLLILTGIAVLLTTLSISGKRAERRLKADSETIRKIRESCGKGDYSSDIFYDERGK